MIFSDFAAYRSAGFKPQVCIVGSGPAGITLARTLAKLSIAVVVLEAGSDDITAESQAFYEGTVEGDPYFELDATRLRYFGGSSNHWAGWCRALDDKDFLPKAWVPDTGWPIRRADIEPFLSEVHDILDLVPFEPDVPVTAEIARIQLIKSPAVRFRAKYRADIEASEKIALVLNTYATRFVGDGRAISAVKTWSNGAPADDVTATVYVSAVGGIENSRLLLWSNEQSGGGVVPKAQALGRYWMEHPQFIAADAVLVRTDAFPLDATNEAFFAPTLEAIEAAKILNFEVRLIAQPYSGIRETIADLACVAPGVAERAIQSVNENFVCGGHLSMGWEQAPNAANHITLSPDRRDDAGVPRLVLHWQKRDIDHRTLLEGLRMFGRSLAEADLGRVRLYDWVPEHRYPDDAELAGHHHMGGTRMGTDPATSVVDADCKVHGMENFYVGGSSVFATAGHANPTTTITALALRLGYHLAKRPDLSA